MKSIKKLKFDAMAITGSAVCLFLSFAIGVFTDKKKLIMALLSVAMLVLAIISWAKYFKAVKSNK